MIRWLVIFLIIPTMVWGKNPDSIKFTPKTFSLIKNAGWASWAEPYSELSGYGNVNYKRVILNDFQSSIADSTFPDYAIITRAYLKVKVATENSDNYGDWNGDLTVRAYGLLDSTSYTSKSLDSVDNPTTAYRFAISEPITSHQYRIDVTMPDSGFIRGLYTTSSDTDSLIAYKLKDSLEGYTKFNNNFWAWMNDGNWTTDPHLYIIEKDSSFSIDITWTLDTDTDLIDTVPRPPYDTVVSNDAGLFGNPIFASARDTIYFNQKYIFSNAWSMAMSAPEARLQVSDFITMDTVQDKWYQYDIDVAFMESVRTLGRGVIVLMADSVGLFSSYLHRRIYNDSTYVYIIYETPDRVVGKATLGGGNW